MRGTLGDPDLDAAGVDRLRRVIRETGALDACEKMISDYLEGALKSLEDAPITPESREALAELAVAATSRRT
nr:hypothetical protein GCM10020093_113910 [Planobispora longispora]